MKSAGIISMGAYIPAKAIPTAKCKSFIHYLRTKTSLHPEYIDMIEKNSAMPGSIETNEDGWKKQPWFETWLSRIPEKKRDNPFQGTKERRRVPLDPNSIRESLHPHPMISSDAECLAGAHALFNGGLHSDEIDLVLVSSLVPDLHVPLNASLVQHKLHLQNAGAYNIDTCCSSFITMLEIAMSYVRMGIKKKVLVIGSSLDSLINDRCSYFSVYVGDAAAAAVVGEVETPYDYLASCSKSHGERHKAIVFLKRKPEIHLYNSHQPTYEQEFVTFYDQNLCKDIARYATKDINDVVFTTLEKAGCTKNEIDFLITHQPVPWAATAWREAIGLPSQRHYESFEKYGNIAVASVPVNLLEAVEQGKIQSGDRVMLASSGVGENHIALFTRISPQFIKNNRID